MHMKNYITRFSTVITLITGVALALPAVAAPPHAVSHKGTPVTTAVPGEPFTMKFQVKNTGTTTFSGVKVIFHIPKEFTHSAVAPANADIQDDIISWSNVPIESDKPFYPSFTFTMESGTPLKTKVNIWVEVTGKDMEATSTNFSVTARAASATKAVSTLSSADISSMFQSVYGRAATASELKYWLGRRTDKPGRTALTGAIAYHKALDIKH